MSDPLDELRDAWRDIEAPPLDDEPDPQTRAAVEWMRAAWHELEAPALPSVPARRLPMIASGVAASLLVAFGLWALGAAPDTPGPKPAAAEHLVPTPVHASIRRDGVAELRSGAVTLVLLDESATPAPEHRILRNVPLNPSLEEPTPGENR